MHIGSGLNTVSSMYRQQKGNNMKTPASGEKTFYTAETPKVYQIFTTDNMLWTGGNGTGLSYCLKYADDSRYLCLYVHLNCFFLHLCVPAFGVHDVKDRAKHTVVKPGIAPLFDTISRTLKTVREAVHLQFR